MSVVCCLLYWYWSWSQLLIMAIENTCYDGGDSGAVVVAVGVEFVW